MKYLVALASGSVLLVSALSSQSLARTNPALSGKYVFTRVSQCVPNGGGAVGVEQQSGTLNFNSATGTVVADTYTAQGNPPMLTFAHESAPYSVTSTTFTLGATTYQATYGKTTKGITTYLSYIGVVSDDGSTCADEGWLSHQ